MLIIYRVICFCATGNSVATKRCWGLIKIRLDAGKGGAGKGREMPTREVSTRDSEGISCVHCVRRTRILKG